MNNNPTKITSSNTTQPKAAPPTTTTTVATTTNNTSSYRLPSIATLQHVSKLAIVEDKPIMLDYWADSLTKSVLIGVKEDKEKLLVKSEDEYTSPIKKIFKVENEYIIMTENSIYVVDVNIQTKRISA